MFNALTFDDDITERAGSKLCSRVFHVGGRDISSFEVRNFTDASSGARLLGDVYLPSLLVGDDIVDTVTEHVLTTGCKLIISACNTLDEVGSCDKRFGVTPVGLAHKLGLLDGAYIAGGVYLDKDDIDLINQSGAKVILTPSDSLGYGHGIPPLRMLLNLGADVYIGTGTGKYDRDADLDFEKRLLALAVSGALCTRDAVPLEILDELMEKMPD